MRDWHTVPTAPTLVREWYLAEIWQVTTNSSNLLCNWRIHKQQVLHLAHRHSPSLVVGYIDYCDGSMYPPQNRSPTSIVANVPTQLHVAHMLHTVTRALGSTL